MQNKIECSLDERRNPMHASGDLERNVSIAYSEDDSMDGEMLVDSVYNNHKNSYSAKLRNSNTFSSQASCEINECSSKRKVVGSC